MKILLQGNSNLDTHNAINHFSNKNETTKIRLGHKTAQQQQNQIELPDQFIKNTYVNDKIAAKVIIKPWKATSEFSLSKKMLNTPFYLLLPSHPQEGIHAFNTKAFQKFFDLGIIFYVPNDDNEKFTGTCKIDNQLYHYSATGMRAKGSGAGIWTVQLTNSKNNTTTEFAIKCNPTKKTGLDNFDQITKQKDMTEILMMDLMSENNHALRFHGAYNTPNGTLIFAMEKAKSNMLTILESRQQDAVKGRLNIEEVDHYLLNMAQGLQDLHRCRQVHGDIKSDNFMLGSDNIPRIADFGESYLDISNQQHQQQVLKNDIHSFAIMAYNMRYGSNKTTDNLAAAIKKQQAKLEVSFNAKVATIIEN